MCTTATSNLRARPGAENFSVLVFGQSSIVVHEDLLGIHFCRGKLLFHIKITHEATRVVRLTHPMALLTTHWHANAIRVVPTLQTATNFLAWILVLALVLIVPLGEWLKNHGIFCLGCLDQIEEVLSRIVADGAMWPTLVMLLVLVTYIVIILALVASAIISRINHG